MNIYLPAVLVHFGVHRGYEGFESNHTVCIPWPLQICCQMKEEQMLAAWQLQVTSSMSAGWPFSTGLSGRPVSSTRIWVLWNKHCAFPATFFATTALLWKKRQNSFKMIQANPGNPSWYWSEVMVHKERERERRHDGKKMEQSWK